MGLIKGSIERNSGDPFVVNGRGDMKYSGMEKSIRPDEYPLLRRLFSTKEGKRLFEKRMNQEHGITWNLKSDAHLFDEATRIIREAISWRLKVR